MHQIKNLLYPVKNWCHQYEQVSCHIYLLDHMYLSPKYNSRANHYLQFIFYYKVKTETQSTIISSGIW